MEKIYPENTNTEVAQLSKTEPVNGINVIDTILFSNLINVIIVIAFFVWIFRKYNLMSFIPKKCGEITETIKNVEEERTIKKNHLESTKIKIKNVHQETLKMINEGEQVTKSLSRVIIMDAEAEASYMQKKAEFLIESERKIAINEAMTEITDAAFIIAQQHIEQAMDENLHKKYIDGFIDNLENLKV